MKRQLIFSVIILLLLSPLLKAQNSGVDTGTEKWISIYFGFDNACELCHEDQDFYDSLLQSTRNVPDKPYVSFYSYNIFKAEARAEFSDVCAGLGIEFRQFDMPMLIIGDEYLIGNDAIYAGAKDLFLRQMDKETITRVKWQSGFAAGTNSKAIQPPKDFPRTKDDNSVLVCFVTTACENCEKAKAFLSTFPDDVEIFFYNVSDNEGYPAARQFFEAYKVPDREQLVPIVFYAGGYLSGLENIQKNLEGVLASGGGRGFVFPGVEAAAPELSLRELPAIFLAGLLGGLNPCSISMILLLLSLLASKSGRILPLGLTYVTARFITYLALGLSLFSLGQIIMMIWVQLVKQN
jgi:hypothetical protein